MSENTKVIATEATETAPPAIVVGDRIIWVTARGQRLGPFPVEAIQPGLNGEQWLRVTTDSVLGQWLPLSEVVEVK